MANIPGLSGYQTPKVVARDRIVSQGVSIPGGLRKPCLMGEGLREETIVASALGSGKDGTKSCSLDNTLSGRYFKLANYPVESGRTELYLNGTLLYGIEDDVDETDFDSVFDYRIQVDSGCIELQSASIADQDGKKYSASSLNVGNGLIVDGTCGDFDLVSVVDENAPAERWTAKCVSVIRDANGDPVPGKAKFTLTGSVSGQLRNSSGQPILFDSAYVTDNHGAVSGSSDVCADGFIVATSTDFGVGEAVARDGDISPTTTNEFRFSGDLVTQGQALAGDTLCIDGYIGIEIDDIAYDSGTDKTTLTLVTDSLSSGIDNQEWEIRAKNLFIDNEAIAHDGITGEPATVGRFTSSAVGKVLMICSGDSAGKYTVLGVTSSRRVRLQKFQDTIGLPDLTDSNGDGLAETGLEWHLLQSNGVLLFGLKEGTVSFKTGDKFFIDVDSRVLKKSDLLEARYISSIDINEPEYMTSAAELFKKYGQPSLTNSLSLGAQMAFENGAPGVWAIQTKPPLPRRTTQTLIEEVDSKGNGGFSACGGSASDCEIDDLKFIIPRPLTGLRSGRPDGDTQVNFFVVRDSEETQFFPNKFGFYNSQFESSTGQNTFISSADYAYSYTIINTDTEILAQGFNGDISSEDGTFSSDEVNFDASHVGAVIVVEKLEDSDGNVYTTSDAISEYLFGNTTSGVELVISAVNTDNSVDVTANDDDLTALIADAVDVQFFVKNLEDTTNVSAAILLHKSLVDSGTLKEGDGIKITYIDENDADFYDVNWFAAFEKLEEIDCQLVAPLPIQNRSGIFQAAVTHCKSMSDIANQKERMALFGAQMGMTVDALLGNELLAVEDIGVVEGIQGDDVEEVLAGNTEDLANYKLDDSFTSELSMYFWPDKIVRAINGTNTFIDGYYLACAASGWFASQQNVALPLTNKILVGFSILRDKTLRPSIMNQLGGVGATIVQPVTGGGKVINGRTTSTSGFIEDEEPSIVFVRHYAKSTLRAVLAPFIGGIADPNTLAVVTSRMTSALSSLVSQGYISSFTNVRVEQDKVDPRQINVYARYIPNYPLNFVFIDLTISSS